jgi:regulator of cell morphogenesis and NO signaling
MEMTGETTIREIVRNDHRAAAIFEKHAIDFCCGGNKTLESVCEQRGIDPALLVRELRQVETASGSGSFRPDQWDPDVLADFIVNTHHRYVRRMLPQIRAHLAKLVSVHGMNHPELSTITSRFEMVAEELTHHMQKEEVVLFPAIKTLVALSTREQATRQAPFSIRRPIEMMEAEHQSAGDALIFIRAASGEFVPPADACETYRVTYRELEDFERDLHQHVHLENNILFPKAISLEDDLPKPC